MLATAPVLSAAIFPLLSQLLTGEAARRPFPKPTCTGDFLNYPENVSINYKRREAFAQ
jgi:hypothetical protein